MFYIDVMLGIFLGFISCTLGFIACKLLYYHQKRAYIATIRENQKQYASERELLINAIIQRDDLIHQISTTMNPSQVKKVNLLRAVPKDNVSEIKKE